MSLIEQQNFTARLFLDGSLRRIFLENAEKIGAENGLNGEEIEIIKQTLNRDFEFFADSLFFKRLNEVEKLLPLTRKVLGKKEFEKLFRAFAQKFTPQSIKKHLEDSIEFVDFLRSENTLEALWLNDLARFEQARLVFNGGGKHFVLRKFRHDIRLIFKELEKFDNSAEIKFPKRTTFAVWFRLGKNGKSRHWVW